MKSTRPLWNSKPGLPIESFIMILWICARAFWSSSLIRHWYVVHWTVLITTVVWQNTSFKGMSEAEKLFVLRCYRLCPAFRCSWKSEVDEEDLDAGHADQILCSLWYSRTRVQFSRVPRCYQRCCVTSREGHLYNMVVFPPERVAKGSQEPPRHRQSGRQTPHKLRTLHKVHGPDQGGGTLHATRLGNSSLWRTVRISSEIA